jgi:hypothetical protein
MNQVMTGQHMSNVNNSMVKSMDTPMQETVGSAATGERNEDMILPRSGNNWNDS